MKYIVSFILGSFSGFVLQMMGTAIFYGSNRPMNRLMAPTLLLPTLFLVGSAVSTLLLVRLAENSAQVIRRASLLGAGEWLLLPLVWGIFGSHAPFQAPGFSAGGDRSLIIGPGVMALLCLATYAVARFMSPNRASDMAIQLKRCSHCGEFAENVARFCNSCGASFAAAGAAGGLGKINK